MPGKPHVRRRGDTFLARSVAKLVAVALLLAAWVIAMPAGGASQPAALSCPSTDLPLVSPGRYITQGRFTTFQCGYSDGLHGFELALNYYPKDTPSAELPARGPRFCTSYSEGLHLVYSPSYFAYANAGGSPKSWESAFAYAKSFLGQAAGVAHPCAAPKSDTRRPLVRAVPSQGVYPRAVKLKFRLTDDSGKAKVGAVVFQGKKPIHRFPYTKLVTANGALWWFNWKPPARFREGVQLTFCVSAVDAAGNKSSDCANFSVLSQ